MALTVDGEDIFGPGPHTVTAGGVERRLRESFFPGLAGVHVLALRGDRQEILQVGLLRETGADAAGAEASLQNLKDAIDELDPAAVHELVDDYGRTYSGLVLVGWSPTGPREGPIRRGTAWEVAQPYQARWLKIDVGAEA